MNIVDLIFIALFALVAIFCFKISFLVALESIISLALSFFIGSKSLNFLLSILEKFGWRENIYTPSLVLILAIVIIWGVIQSLFSIIFSKKTEATIFSKCFSFVFAFIFALIVATIACLTFPPFFSSSNSYDCLTESRICSLSKKLNLSKSLDLSALQGNVLNFMTPKSETDAIILPDYLKKNGQNMSAENEIFSLVNQERKTNDLKVLAADANLNLLAQNYAETILQTKYFSHYDMSKKMPDARAKAANYNFNYFGENLAIAENVQVAHKILMDSSAHKENILSPIYQRVGIAVFNLKPNSILVVEEFSN
ncbi:MAG: CAP domain-containing protein [Candidatus Berkelbacteria bacterium]|nr:CAP domain-containing protein [Candidatus Berkelbacteria bacterium]